MRNKPKKPFLMHRVECGGCGRARWWDEEKDFSAVSCPECGSDSVTFRIVEVTE